MIRESGAKKSSIKVFTDDRPVDKKGNPLPNVVMMVARFVAHNRKKMMPLKSIYLCPAYFNKFDHWSRTHMLEKEADSKIMLWTFDGVEIFQMEEDHIIRNEKGNDQVDWDYYVQTVD